MILYYIENNRYVRRIFNGRIFLFVSGDKPHACELCQKKFALACNLRAHMKTHESEYTISNTYYIPIITTS